MMLLIESYFMQYFVLILIMCRDHTKQWEAYTSVCCEIS